MSKTITKGEETRATILDRALDIASLGGLESLTIGSLADALGMSKSGLFAHFGAKSELQIAVLRRASERFIATVMVPALKRPRGEPRARAVFDGWLAWDRDAFPGGCPLDSAIHAYDDVEGPIRDFVVDAQRQSYDALAQVARNAVESKAFRDDLDPRAFAFEVLNILGGYRRHARLFREPDAEALARYAFEDLMQRCRPTS